MVSTETIITTNIKDLGYYLSFIVRPTFSDLYSLIIVPELKFHFFKLQKMFFFKILYLQLGQYIWSLMTR